MGKIQETTLIIGEGPTEFYYFESLRDVYKHVVIRPDYPKHTSIKELEAKIAEGISHGFSHIFCIIDMDTKENTSNEYAQYVKLKTKYNGVIDKPKKGICCEIDFFETHRCTELFFLYYFHYTSRMYVDQPSLLKDLNKYVEYEKTENFFKKCRGLHTYLERQGGNLETAIVNAQYSMAEKKQYTRDYTYSELGRMINRLQELECTNRK